MEESKKVVFIRRENKNKWERRVALVPSDCKKLIEQGIRVIVQPSELRCYTDHQYKDANCELSEDPSQADLVIGVKEVPLEYLLKDKTFMYFSHTIKGQPGNMPALRDILRKNVRLIDYELIKEDKKQNPQRLVAFGRFAGIAGAVDFLQGLGEFLLYKNFASPFIHTGYSYMFPSVDDAKHSVEKVGALLSKKLLPAEICPFIVGFTSNGRVSQGAQEILKLLPHEYIDPDNLHTLFKKGAKVRRDIVYLTVMESKHMYLHKETENFDKTEFYANPHKFKSVFAEKFVPYLSILYHCMFWDNSQPRILSLEEAHDMCQDKKFRILGISDITCDLKGSIELLQKFTTIESPFFTIDPITNIIEDKFKKMSENSILYHAVDHLPAEYPIDASKHFSEKLYPFIRRILDVKYPSEYEEKAENQLPSEILNACETWNGKLMPNYSYLSKELAKHFPEYRNVSDSQSGKY